MTLQNNFVGQLLPLFYTQSNFFVSLDEPDPLEVVNTVNYEVQWSFTGTQVSYVVQIFEDASADTLHYTSGVVVSAVKQHTLTIGALENLTSYWIVVTAIADDGSSGESDLVEFSTSFAPSVQVTGVSVRAWDACSDALDAPFNEIRWSQIVPGPGETWFQWRILRRKPGEITWVTIGTLSTQATLVYRDRFPQSYLGYEYAVLWVATATGILISTPQSPPVTVISKFDYAWLQSVDDPDQIIRIDAWDGEVESVQDMVTSVTAGRRAPTAFTGEPLYHIVRIPASPRLASDSLWLTFEEFLDAQSEGTIFCLRLGKQRQRFFGVIHGQRRTNQQKTFGVGFTFTEVHYPEDVDA